MRAVATNSILDFVQLVTVYRGAAIVQSQELYL